MERRRLGATGLEVSAVGLGAARLALPARERTGRDPADSSTAARVLRAATARGCTHLDTADGYGLGAGEALIGALLAGAPPGASRPVVTTKVGWNFYNTFVSEPTRRHARGLGIDLAELPPGAVLPFDHGQNFSPEYLEFAVARSLERLRTDRVDVLLLHVPPLRALRGSGWDGALRRLRAAGACAFYGVSVRHPIEVLAALEHGRPDVIQVPVGLLTPAPMRAALAAARRRGVGLIGRELLLSGRLIRWLSAQPGPAGTAVQTGRLVRLVVADVLAAGLVDAVVVGCSTPAQAADVFAAGAGPAADPSDRELVGWARHQLTRLLAAGRAAVPAPAGPVPTADLDRFARSRTAGPGS
jgi:aryl-alcohol dehydrogenase-like predicted oxidoreductase